MNTDLSAPPRLRYVLVGRSGSGKSTMSHFLEKDLGLRRCITHTTRPPREGEVDGRDYHFVSSLNERVMFEHSRFGAYWYGTSWDELSQSDFIILEPQGVAYFRTHFPGPLTVLQLERSNIAVDPDRMLRDRQAGFDDVHPDVLITGDTIEEMSASLISLVRGLESSRCFSSLQDRIRAAEDMRPLPQHSVAPMGKDLITR